MKHRVVFIALLCLLLLFTGAYAADTDPVAYKNLVYTGSPQVLVNAEDILYEGFTDVICRLAGVTRYSRCDAVTGTDADTYNVEYVLLNLTEPLTEPPESTSFTPTGTISVTIAKAPLTVTPNTDVRSKVYGNPDPASFQYSVSGLANGETWKTNSPYLSRETGETVGDYNFILGNIYDNGSFKVSNYEAPKIAEGIVFKIEPKVVELAWSGFENLTYNGKEQCPTVTVTNLEEGDSCSVTVTGGGTNAGNYTATAESLDNPNYKLPENRTQDFTIGKVAVYVKPKADSKTYGAPDPEEPFKYEIVSGSGTPLTDKLEKSGALGRVEGETVNEDGYAFTMGDLKLAERHAINYDLTLQPDEGVKFTITPRVAQITWDGNSFPYDGASHPTAKVTNRVGDDDIVVTVEGEQTEAIPASDVYIATATGLTGADSSNYVLPDPAPTKRFRINPVKLTLTWVEPFKFEYSGESQHPSFTLTGCVGSDAADSEGTCTETFIEKNIVTEGNTTAGTYQTKVYLSEEQKNYKLSYTDTDYTITPKDITLNWEDTNFNEAGEILLEYNGKFQSPKVSIHEGSLVGGDTCKLKFEDDDQLKNVKSGRKKAEASFVEEDCNKNYTITNPMAIFRIAPMTVDLTWEGDKFPYTGDKQKPTASYTDVNGNTINVPAESIKTDPVSSVNAGSYFASAESDDQNYQFSEATATHDFTITPKTVNVTWDTNTFEYNGEIQRPEPSIEEGGLAPVDADRCVVVSKGGKKDASETAYTADAQWAKASDVSCASNYALENSTIDYFINPFEAEIVWDTDSFIYNGSEQCPVASVNNLFTGDDCVVTVMGGQTNVGEDYKATATALSNTNYKLPENPFITFEITPAEVDIEWSNEDPFTYNGDPQAPTAQYKDIAGELKDAAISITDTAGNPLENAVDAGDYTAIASIADQNYTFADKDKATKYFIINKGTLTVVPTEPLSKTYGSGVDPTFNYEIRNVKGKDVRTGVEQAGSWLARDYTIEEKAGQLYDFDITYITLKDKYAKNYDLVLDENIKFSITDGVNEITHWPSSLDNVYNGSEQDLIDPVTTAHGTVMYSLDKQIWSANVPTAKDVVELTYYFYVDGGDNYSDIMSPEEPYSAIARILPRPLTVTPEAKSKVYGEVDPELTYEFSGNVEGETPVFTGALKRAAGEDVDTYFIRKGDLALDPNADVNKNYVYEPATGFTQKVLFTITPKVVELTWSDTEFTYDGTSHVPAAEVTNKGDDECVVTVEGEQTNAGTGYPATATALSNPNYTLEGAANINTTFDILPAVLTVTPKADQSKIWDGEAPAEIEYDVIGAAADDEPAFIGELTIGDVYDAGEYPIQKGTLSLDDPNYSAEFTFTEGVIYTIKKAPSSITTAPAKVKDLKYNGEPHTLITAGAADGGEIWYRLTGVNDSYSTELPQAIDANEKYTVHYYVKGDKNHEDLGSEENPYNLVYVGIAPAEVTVKADDITITYGDPEPTLTATVTGLQGQDTKDLIVYELKREEGSNAGTYVITASGDKNQGNYVVSFESGTLTINKAQSAFAADPKGIPGLVYNGQPQTLIEAGQTKDGEIQYRLVGGSGYSTELPQATDANEKYCVQYYIKGDENHEDLGSAASPYNLVYVPIAQADVTVTAEDKTIIYGEPEPKLTAKVEGLKGEDSEDLVEYTISRESGDNVGEYVITPAGEKSQGNYSVSFVPGKLTIGKASVTVKVIGREVTEDYDGKVHSTMYDMFITSDPTNKYVLEYVKFVGTAWRIDETNADEYVLELKPADFENTNGNYEVTFETTNGKLTINKAEATVIADDKTKVYGENDPELTAKVVGLYGDDTVSYMLTRAEGEDVGSYEITASGEENQGNYHVNFINGSLTISKAQPSIITEPKAISGLIYNGQPQNIVEPGTAEGGTIMYFFKGGEKTETPPQGTDAGEYRVYYYVQGDKNHENLIDKNNTEDPYRYRGVKAAIKPAEVTVIADNKEKTYGEEDPVFTATVNGTFGSDTVAYTFSREGGEDVGEYEITVTGEESQGNYHVTFVPGKLTINKAMPTITVEPKAKEGLVYNGQPQDLLELGTADGGTIMYFFKGGEKSATPPQGTDAGEYSVYYYVQGDKNHSDLIDENNTEDPYRYHGVKATIGQAEVTVTADNKEKTYGEPDPVFTATVEGTFGSDTVAYTFSRESGEDVGEYAITVTGEESQGNYHVTFVPGKLTINKAKPTITAEPKAISGLIYNGQPQDIVEPGTADGGTIMYFFKGGEKTATPPQGTDAGEYRVYYYVQGDSNHYDLIDENNTDDPYRYNGVKVTIAQKEVTVTADDKTKRYGEQDPEFTATVTGTIGDDTVTYKLSREAGENVGEYAITPEGEVSQGNYTVIYVPGKLTIEKVPASIVTPPSALTPAPIYNGEEQVLINGGVANGGVIWFRIQGESEYKGAWDLPKGKDAGEYVIEYFVIGDDNHTNYGSADEPFTMTAGIAPKPVHIIWGNTELTYNGEPQVPVAYVPDEEIVNGDTVKVIYSDDSRKTDAGEGYIATVIGLNNSNYTLADDENKTKFNIAKADYVEGVDFIAPDGIDGLSYTGQPQDLITEGTGDCVDENYCTFQYGVESFESEMITKDASMSEDVPQGTDVGTYTISWMIKGDANHNDYIASEPIIVRIAPTELTAASIVITPATKFVYDGLMKTVSFTVINSEGVVLTEGVDYRVVRAVTREINIGTYDIVISAMGGYRGENLTRSWRIVPPETVTPFDFHRLNGFWNRETNCPAFGCGQELPATGFPTSFRMPLAVRPDELKYADLGMTLQIPALEVSVDLVGVPQVGNDWAIEWLGANAGILSGTSEPGRGYTMIAGHNHLNESEMGPFRNIGSLKQYDTIYITLDNGTNLPFSVYANELLRPDDYEEIAKIALEDPNSIVLVTCENESKDGGYLNRRVVFAKPF